MTKYDWQVVGHEKICQYLQTGLDNDKLAHAYLFSGLEHLGKGLVVEKFLASILCQDYHKNAGTAVAKIPCGQCVFCNELAKGIHPDVYFLKKEADKKNISVEQVREMQKFLNLSSFLNSYKIALINQADDLSESAQNALLKVLEEPRKKTLLFLICRDSDLLLPTISSRCQLIKFYPIAQDAIFHHLVGLGATREQAHLLSSLSGGQIGLALNFFHNSELFESYKQKVAQFLRLCEVGLKDKFLLIDETLSDLETPQEKKEFLAKEFNLWEIILRDVLLSQKKLEANLVNQFFKDKLGKLGQKYRAASILHILAEIKKAKKYLNYNVNPKLIIENLVLNF